MPDFSIFRYTKKEESPFIIIRRQFPFQNAAPHRSTFHFRIYTDTHMRIRTRTLGAHTRTQNIYLHVMMHKHIGLDYLIQSRIRRIF